MAKTNTCSQATHLTGTVTGTATVQVLNELSASYVHNSSATYTQVIIKLPKQLESQLVTITVTGAVTGIATFTGTVAGTATATATVTFAATVQVIESSQQSRVNNSSSTFKQGTNKLRTT